MTNKRAGLGDKKEGKRLKKALESEPEAAHVQIEDQEPTEAHASAHVQIEDHETTYDHTHVHDLDHKAAQQYVQEPAPPQRHDPVIERLHCLVTSSQKEYIKKLAETWGVSQGEVIRYLIEYYRAKEMK